MHYRNSNHNDNNNNDNNKRTYYVQGLLPRHGSLRVPDNTCKGRYIRMRSSLHKAHASLRNEFSLLRVCLYTYTRILIIWRIIPTSLCPIVYVNRRQTAVRKRRNPQTPKDIPYGSMAMLNLFKFLNYNNCWRSPDCFILNLIQKGSKSTFFQINRYIFHVFSRVFTLKHRRF